MLRVFIFIKLNYLCEVNLIRKILYKFRILVMTQRILSAIVVLICIYSSVWAQKPKATSKKQTTTSSQQSTAEKMGYARTSKYWGPGTYYCYAPGVPNNKMANNTESRMRDLIGISGDDFYQEIARQGFVEVPQKEMQKWFNRSNNKELKFFYAPDKSYVLRSGVRALEKSPALPNGEKPQVSTDICRIQLFAKADSLKVIDAIWQYLRDMNELKVLGASMASDFKKAELKIYPIQRIGTSGWASLRAGTFVLQMVDGKPKGIYEPNEVILHRTIGKPDFKLHMLSNELAYTYILFVTLTKDGYVLEYNTIPTFFKELEPGTTWEMQYPREVEHYKMAVKMEKDAVDMYKQAPMPPVLVDIDKLLHIR